MQLLIERDAGLVLTDPDLLKEGVSVVDSLENAAVVGRSRVAILQHSDKENKNGRIYPHSLLEREMRSYRKLIGMGNAFGEVDHPERTEVYVKYASHRITDLWWEGKQMLGKVEFLVSRRYLEDGTITTDADRVWDLLERYGATIGMSSRGTGTTYESMGKTYVKDNFGLICWDVVHDPSTHTAYIMGPEGVMSHGTLHGMGESSRMEGAPMCEGAGELERIRRKLALLG